MASKRKQRVVRATDLTEGDLIEFDRAMGTYSHWAVYIGNGNVIHLSSDPDASGKFNFVADINAANSVRQDKLRRVAGDSYTYRNNEFDGELRPNNNKEIVKRAHQRLGQAGYNLATYNCEHFATECRYGEARSKQVETVGQRAIDLAIPGPYRAIARGDITEMIAPPVKWAVDKMISSHPGDLVQF